MTVRVFIGRARRLVAGCLLLALAGAAMVGLAATMPPFTDPSRVVELLSATPPQDRVGRLAFTAQWHAEMDRVRTGKWLIHDLGRALIALAVTLFGLALFFKVRTWRELRRVRTPRTVGGLLVLAAAVIATPILISLLWQLENLERLTYPPWQDAVGVPVLTKVYVVLATGPFIWLATLYLVRGARPPVRLRRPTGKPRSRAWFVGVLCESFMVGQACAVFNTIPPYYFPFIPYMAAVVYVFASTRSLWLAKQGRSAREGRTRPPRTAPR